MLSKNGRSFCILVFLGVVCYTEERPGGSPDETAAIESSTLPTPPLDQNVSLEIITSNRSKIRILSRGGQHTAGYLGDFEDHEIIFPDSYQVIFESNLRIDGKPRCAASSTYCENFESYPYRHIEEALKRQHIRADFFGKDEAPEEKINISNRIGEVDEYICTSLQRTIFPKVGKTKNNKWKYVINQHEVDGYIQGVRIETCKDLGSPCNIIGELPTGYVTSCKQKYIYRRLMSITDNGEPVPDTFQLPSACCCSYRKDVAFLARFGAQVTPARTKVKG